MNISINEASIKTNQVTFSEIEKEIYSFVMGVAREMLKAVLKKADNQLAAERDSKRFRDKGYRRTTIKTLFGEVEYERRVYKDTEATEHCYVYLLDEALGISKVGLVSSEVCKLIATSICESSYRATANQITELTGLSISQQAVWNIVQSLGEHQGELVTRYSECSKENQGQGEVETPILYEENDGIWIKLQGEAREKNGASKEMKVGIAYDGVEYHVSKRGKIRRILHNKIAYAGFMPIKEFRAKKEGLIANRFDVDSIELRVVNGDGANWIQKQKKKDVETICVLDEFHRNKKIKECIKNKEHAKIVENVLFEGNTNALLEFLEACLDSGLEESEEAGFRELYTYYDENRKALKGYYDRGIEIPKTNAPGVVHHARLGSMESNVFTLIGNRMKGRRACWSIKGANNMAMLLCAYHTSGFENLFASIPEIPVIEMEWIDEGKPLAASKVKEFVGKGYSFPGNISTQGSASFMRELSKELSKSNII